MPHPLVLIDGSSWLFRAYYGIREPLTSPDGRPTGAVFGMANMLRKLLTDHAPERVAIVFDPAGPTERTDLYAEYKANRDDAPEDLSAQFPMARALFEAMGLPVLQVDRVEADDVIGTLAAAARREEMETLIVTADKDMAQLVDSRTHLLDTMKDRRLDPEGVREKFGVPPERIVDWLTLVGDTSDNIPGVRGVGPKTASKWLAEYGSLDALLACADEIKGKAGEQLRAFVDQVPLTRKLVTIRTDVEVPALEALRPKTPEPGALAAMFRELGFTRWLAEVEGASNGEPQDDPADGPAPQGDAEYITVLDARTFGQMLKSLEAATLICLDTETDSLDPMRARLVGLSFAVAPGQAWYLPLAHDYLGAPKQLDFDDTLARLKPLLEDPARPKVGQHIKYDVNVLSRHGIAVEGIVADTMLESYVLDATGHRHDLDSMAELHLGHRTIRYQAVAGKGKSQIPFNQVAIDKAAPYAAEDAEVTLRLHQALHPRLDDTPKLRDVFESIEVPLVPVLARVERNGVQVDAKALAQISREFGERMEQLQADAWKAAGHEFNLGSPPQLQKILYEEVGLPVRAKTPKGKPSTAEDTLADLVAEHPLPGLILQWRALSKLRSTYADNLPRSIHPDTGRIHTSYHQAVAATGRLSSADPNLQNIPVRTAEGRRIREAFTAPRGRRLLSIDYSQIELRLMAHFSGDPGLQQAFRDGKDVHRATAAEVFGVALGRVSDEQRRAAKAINFGLIYGMSAFGLAKQLGVTRTDAAAYMQAFFERYPGVRDFMDRTREHARELGWVQTLYGRRLYLPNIGSRNAAQRQYAERTAINAPLQGTAADLIKLAMIDVDRWLASAGRPLDIIMQVHDELVFEGPTAAVKDAAATLAQRMCRIASLEVPLVADWGIGIQWNQSHTKLGQASSHGL